MLTETQVSLSNKTKILHPQYKALSCSKPAGFTCAPGSGDTSDWNITSKGVLSSNSQQLAFAIDPQIQKCFGTSIDSAKTGLNARMNDNEGHVGTKYYVVDTGIDLDSNNWSITVNLDNGSGGTGTWVFAKARTGDDI